MTLAGIIASCVAAGLLVVVSGFCFAQTNYNGTRISAQHGFGWDVVLGALALLMISTYAQIDGDSFGVLAFFLGLRAFWRFRDDVSPALKRRDLLTSTLLSLIGLLSAALCFKSWQFAISSPGWQHVLSIANLIALAMCMVVLAILVVVTFRTGRDNPLLGNFRTTRTHPAQSTATADGSSAETVTPTE